MKITIISLDNWGYNKYLYEYLLSKNVEASYINFHEFRYKYSSPLDRVKNFLRKKLLRKNIKKEVLHEKILGRLEELGKQDVILMIKADYLLPKTIKSIKVYSDNFISFFNDNFIRSPRIKHNYTYFDKVYSFEKEDVEAFGFSFKTNFIYNELIDYEVKEEFTVFNISSYDIYRLSVIEKIAEQLDLLNKNYKIINVGNKAKPHRIETNIEFTPEKLNLKEISSLMKKSKILLDVNRINQHGLTFRVFECMGARKKLITTNRDIINYDFYNPMNILVINENNVNIPQEFIDTPYEDIPSDIYEKYTIKGWFKDVLPNL